MADGFVKSGEFAPRDGGAYPANSDDITKLYNNILHRPPEQVDFSESAESVAGMWGVGRISVA